MPSVVLRLVGDGCPPCRSRRSRVQLKGRTHVLTAEWIDPDPENFLCGGGWKDSGKGWQGVRDATAKLGFWKAVLFRDAAVKERGSEGIQRKESRLECSILEYLPAL